MSNGSAESTRNKSRETVSPIFRAQRNLVIILVAIFVSGQVRIMDAFRPEIPPNPRASVFVIVFTMLCAL